MTKKIRSILMCLGVIFISQFAFSQTDTLPKLKWGIEYDLMAPRIGKWHSVHLNAYVGHGRFKRSLVFAGIQINSRHLTDESFQQDHIIAFGYRAEVFSHKELKRWSTGLILLFSTNDVITSINQQAGSFNTFMIGLPIGYTWVLWKHLTINPNLSILVPLTNRTISIGTDIVRQAPWGLEPGLRIGYRF
ncbi:MAG TPA: hypothetical protein PLM49_04980 [Bacteroidales bacterium]|nr:hypothetical protein [Bacteroidales bacterium]